MVRAIWDTVWGAPCSADAPSTCQRALVRPISRTSASPASSSPPLRRNTVNTSRLKEDALSVLTTCFHPASMLSSMPLSPLQPPYLRANAAGDSTGLDDVLK